MLRGKRGDVSYCSLDVVWILSQVYHSCIVIVVIFKGGFGGCHLSRFLFFLIN